MTSERILAGVCASAALATAGAGGGGSTAAPAGDPDARAMAAVQQMTLAEKLQLMQGEAHLRIDPETKEYVPTPGTKGGDGYSPGVPRLGVPDLQMIGAGLGVTNLGKRKNGSATVFPSTLALAASFDRELAYDLGREIGRQTRDQGFNVSLGGAVNLIREASGGRNFEYMSEDPILSGKLMAQNLRGIQDQKIVATIKHFAINDQETGRMVMNVRMDERTMRETDLLAFEIGIKESGVGAVMSAYNGVNGVYASESPYLLNTVLKGEWKFAGWVMSDWGATHSAAPALNAGLDQEMFKPKYFGEALEHALAWEQVSQARIDDAVRRILRSLYASGVVDDPPQPKPIDREAGAAVAQRIAEEGTVLLKNDGALLPLKAGAALKIVVVGGHADRAVLTGGGSAQVESIGGNAVAPKKPPPPGPIDFRTPVWTAASPMAAIQARDPGAEVRFVSGEDLAEAAQAAAHADVAIVFAVQHRTEGLDTGGLSLPDGQDELIEAVAHANPKTVVVLESGGAVLTPWAERVGAVLAVWYPGERGPQALARILFGDVNPSGKLPVTFPAKLSDLPRPHAFNYEHTKEGESDDMKPFTVTYVEGLAVGYKWFDAKGLKPAFEFGHGLSYTRFEYRDLKVASGERVKVSFHVHNAGGRDGDDVAQVYVAFPPDAGEPPRRLAGWSRLSLHTGESKRVEVEIDPLALSIWDVKAQRWRKPLGVFQIFVGPLRADFHNDKDG